MRSHRSHRSMVWPRWKIWMLGACLVAMTATVLWPVVGFDFVAWDDDLHVYENPRFAPVTWSNIAAFWQAPYEHLYMPLTYTVWAALVWISDAIQPGPLSANLFHRLNLLLHLSSVLLVYRLGLFWLPMTGPNSHRATAAALGAIVFGLHPLQVEAVAWVSGLKDVLCGFFALLAVWQYCAYVQAAGVKRHWGHYTLATMAFGCALLAKPAAVITPLVAGLLAANCATAIRRRYTLQALGSWVVVAVVWSIWTKTQQPDTALTFIPSWWGRLIVAIDTVVFYGRQLVWPLHLGPDYGRTPQIVTAQGWPLISGGILVMSGLALWWQRRRFGAIGLAAAVFIVGVLPVLGMVPFLFQAYSTVADRYTYFAMLGVALGLGWLGQTWAYTRMSLLVVAVVVGGLLGWRSSQQVQIWRDTSTLFTHALQINPRSAVAHNNLGLTLAHQQRLPEAIMHYRQALQLKATMPEAHYNLGDAFAAQGESDSAIGYYTSALRFKPTWAEAHNNLGTALARQGKLDDAIAHYTQALQLKPDWALPYNNLGDAMVKQGRVMEAITVLTKAAQLKPVLPEAPYNLAGILWQQGYHNEAIVAYREALRRRPHWPQAANNLARLLVTQTAPATQDIFEAVLLAEQACHATNYQNPITLRTLAAAYHAAGQGLAAVRVAQQALSHANAAGDLGLVAEIQAQLQEYQTTWQPQALPF